MMQPSTYRAIHRRLWDTRGPASDYTCPCGEPAQDWAYQFTGSPELRSSDGGFPHSTDPDDYEPRCRKCHTTFDVEHDPTIAEKQQESGRRNAATRVERMRTDTAFADRIREANRQNGVATSRIRRQCTECGLTTNPGYMGVHQKSSGHQGWTQEK